MPQKPFSPSETNCLLASMVWVATEQIFNQQAVRPPGLPGSSTIVNKFYRGSGAGNTHRVPSANFPPVPPPTCLAQFTKGTCAFTFLSFPLDKNFILFGSISQAKQGWGRVYVHVGGSNTN